MKTKLIGIKQFSQNVSKVLKEAQEKNIHFVVMRHQQPVVNITPAKKSITEDDLRTEGIDVEELKKDIAVSRAEAARGELYTTEEVLEFLRNEHEDSLDHKRKKTASKNSTSNS